MMAKAHTPTEVGIVRSGEIPTTCRSYGANRNFITAIAIKIALLRSWEPRIANGEP